MKLKFVFVLVLSSGILISAVCKKDKPLIKLPKEQRELFGYIPAVSFTLEADFSSSILNGGLDSNRTVTLNSFYCATTEVSNLEYRNFLNDLKTPELLRKAEIDSVRWRVPLQYNEPYVELYHIHPAYDSYPAVNIPFEGALMYCQWLEKKLNANSENEYFYRVNLPTREQWIAAATGGLDLSPYPWGGPYVRNVKGRFLANFNGLSAENIHYNEQTKSFEVVKSTGSAYYLLGSRNDYADITAPVDSFFPNGYKLYNMSGNVAEMVLEEGLACGGGWRSTGFDIKCSSTMKYTTPQSDIGFRPVITLEMK